MEKVLVLKSVEPVDKGTEAERKVCTFEAMAKSPLTGTYRRIIGSGTIVSSIFSKRYSKGELVDNADYESIDEFVGDVVPGMHTAAIMTSPFNYMQDVAGTPKRNRHNVVVFNDRDILSAALYDLRGTGASFFYGKDELGNDIEHKASTKAEWEAKKAQAQKESDARKKAADGVKTPETETEKVGA